MYTTSVQILSLGHFSAKIKVTESVQDFRTETLRLEILDRLREEPGGPAGPA